MNIFNRCERERVTHTYTHTIRVGVHGSRKPCVEDNKEFQNPDPFAYVYLINATPRSAASTMTTPLAYFQTKGEGSRYIYVHTHTSTHHHSLKIIMEKKKEAIITTCLHNDCRARKHTHTNTQEKKVFRETERRRRRNRREKKHQKSLHDSSIGKNDTKCSRYVYKCI